MHEPSGIEIDLSLATLPFEREVIERAVERTIRGVTCPANSRAWGSVGAVRGGDRDWVTVGEDRLAVADWSAAR
jgi:hypothetical protein